MSNKNILPLGSFSDDDKIRAMKLIDDNEGNISRASRALGISRQTLIRWKATYWNTYLRTKELVNNQSLSIEAKKLVLYDKTGQLVDKLTTLQESILNFYTDNPEVIKGMTHSERIDLLKNIAPYVVEKKVIRGVNDKTPTQQNNFFGNMYNQLVANNNGNNGNQA